jgi:MFS family permease
VSKENDSTKDKSLGYFQGEAAASAVETASTAYQSPSLVASGAADKDVALLSTLTNLILSFVLIKTPSVLRRGGSLKRVMLFFSLISVLTWIPLILVLLIFNTVSPAWLIPLWILSLVPTLFTGPMRDNWLADKIPAHRLGHYLSLRSAIYAITYITFFFLMGYVLDHSAGHIFHGYALILLFAFGASLASLILYKVISAPRTEVEKNSHIYFGFIDFLKETKRGNLGKYILYIATITFAVNLCSAFFVVYMFKDLHFSYLYYAIIVSSEYVSRTVSLTFWGKQVDRVGSVKILGIISMFIPIIPILWLFSSNIFYLVVVQIISGAVWSAFDLCSQTIIYRGAVSDLRLRYIVYNKSLTTFSIALGALIGAFLINHIFPIFGNTILGLFLVSGIVRLIIVAVVLPRLDKRFEEVSTVMNSEDKELADNVQVNKVSPRLGLSYQQHNGRNLANRPIPVIKTFSHTGLFYHPENWVDRDKSRNVKDGLQVVLPNTGMYYYPERWHRYHREVMEKVPSRAVYPSDVKRLGLDKPSIVLMYNKDEPVMSASCN